MVLTLNMIGREFAAETAARPAVDLVSLLYSLIILITRPLPIISTLGKISFDWIVMNVIYCCLKMVFISDKAVPVFSLPECKLPVGHTVIPYRLIV